MAFENGKGPGIIPGRLPRNGGLKVAGWRFPSPLCLRGTNPNLGLFPDSPSRRRTAPDTPRARATVLAQGAVCFG